jgi:hypothetical protein
MTSIGITVDCEKRCMRWGGTEIPLKTRTTLNDNEYNIVSNTRQHEMLLSASSVVE